MKKILIVDSSKASLVMTSEVFKDHYPGVQVVVATTSSDALKLAKQHSEYDAFIIDFDLPDSNGADTAVQLKGLSSTPILITAFDSPQVQQLISTSLAQYADCQNWLKKPVDPDVVIAVAQRFCDGKMRLQKRVPCKLPAFAELILKKPEPVKTKAKTKTTAKSKSPTKAKSSPKTPKETPINSTYLYGIVEDCSLNGIKFKPIKHKKMELSSWNHILKNMELLAKGDPISLMVQIYEEIEGNVNTKIFTNLPSLPSDELLKKKKNYATKLQKMTGKIAWTSSDSGEWTMGIEFDDEMISKRLFESIVASQSKKRLQQPQTIIKSLKGHSPYQVKKKRES